MDEIQLNKVLDWLKLHCKKNEGYIYVGDILRDIEEPEHIKAITENNYEAMTGIEKLYAQKLIEDQLIYGEWAPNSMKTYHIQRISPRVLDLDTYPNSSNLQFEKLSNEYQIYINQLIQEYLKLNKLEQDNQLKEIFEIVKNLKNEMEQEKAKKILDDNRIDVTFKLKFFLPLIIAQPELEFSSKNKLPTNFAELKELFIKKDKY